MATFSKTVNRTLLSLQSIASNTVVVGSAVDVSTLIVGTALIHFGRRTNAAFTTAPTFRIEMSAKSSGDGFWWPLAQFSPVLGTSLTAQAVNGTVASGQNVITMTSTTNFAVGDIIYIDNTTIANSEWGRVKTVTTNTSVTIEDNLVNAQTSSTVYRAAEMYPALLDLSAVTRLRLVADGSGTGQAMACEAFLVTADSVA